MKKNTSSLPHPTKEEILQKVIEKAVKNGFVWHYHEETTPPKYDWLAEYLINTRSWPDFIYQHDFAKAFWGEYPQYTGSWRQISDKPFEPDNGQYIVSSWQHHLQQMVISEDPLEYLERFL